MFIKLLAALVVTSVAAYGSQYDFNSIVVPTLDEVSIHNTEDVSLLEDCLLLEAAGEGRLGLEAVASVIARRARQRGTTMTQQIMRISQMSAMNDFTSGRITRQQLKQRANKVEGRMRHVARQAILDAHAGRLEHVVPGATHYYAHRILTPAWAHSKTKVRVIGGHTFVR